MSIYIHMVGKSERCTFCDGELKPCKEIYGILEVARLKCEKCEETFFPAGETLGWEIANRRRDISQRKYTLKIKKAGTSPKIFI